MTNGEKPTVLAHWDNAEATDSAIHNDDGK
jgi:hypothetical protein